MAGRLSQRDDHTPQPSVGETVGAVTAGVVLPRLVKTPRAIRPRVADARAFEQALRIAYLNPFIRSMQDGLAKAAAANQAYRTMDDVVEKMAARPQHGIPTELIQKHLDRMEGRHRKDVITSFRTALGVDVRPFLSRPEVAAYMRQKVAENADLIRSLPPRMRDNLKRRLQKEMLEHPFDQELMTRILKHEFGVTGFNMRRIVRDQVASFNGQLTELRHSQLGITEFVWRSVADERVRPECAADDGNKYRWSEGSPQDGARPGSRVQCRCIAEAVVTTSKVQSWKGGA